MKNQKKILAVLAACIMLVNAGDDVSPLSVTLGPRGNVDDDGKVIVDVYFTGTNVKSALIPFEFDTNVVELLLGDEDNTYWWADTSAINKKMALTTVGDGTENDPPSLAFTEAVTLNNEKLLQLEFKLKKDLAKDETATISVGSVVFGVIDASSGNELVFNIGNNPELFIITDAVIKNQCEHTSTHPVSAKAATCCEKGWTAGVQCDNCEEIISGCEEIGIDSNNHAYYGAWGKYDKDNHVRTCKCGHKDYAGHTWDNGVTANGVITYMCTICGETKVEEAEETKASGDLDKNGVLDNDDLVYLLMHMNFPEFYPVDIDCDFDKSGSLDNDDLVYLLMHMNFPEFYPIG